MNKDISNEIRDTEAFIIAQFIDVIDTLDKYDRIEDIKLDMKNRKKIYEEITFFCNNSNCRNSGC